MNIINQFSKEEKVVSMLEFDGFVFVATNLNVYKIVNDKLEIIKLGEKPKHTNFKPKIIYNGN